jgi:hypothetical protein
MRTQHKLSKYCAAYRAWARRLAAQFFRLHGFPSSILSLPGHVPERGTGVRIKFGQVRKLVRYVGAAAPFLTCCAIFLQIRSACAPRPNFSGCTPGCWTFFVCVGVSIFVIIQNTPISKCVCCRRSSNTLSSSSGKKTRRVCLSFYSNGRDEHLAKC